MAVRGAPAIAIAGALALAVDLQNEGAGKQFASAQEARHYIQDQLEYLVTRSGSHDATLAYDRGGTRLLGLYLSQNSSALSICAIA